MTLGLNFRFAHYHFYLCPPPHPTLNLPNSFNSIKTGKVVICLTGRYAGKKAIVVSTFDKNAKRPFPHVLVAGLERAPRQVTKAMTKSQIVRRSQVKVFVKYVNIAHVMPTRYSVNDIEVKSVATPERVDKISLRKQVRGSLKSLFTKAYLKKANDKNVAGQQYFFQKLRF